MAAPRIHLYEAEIVVTSIATSMAFLGQVGSVVIITATIDATSAISGSVSSPVQFDVAVEVKT